MEKWLKQYALGVQEIKEVDLRQCYMQQRPNHPFDRLLVAEDGSIDSHLNNSPHYGLMKLYVEKGERKARKRFRRTLYYKMIKMMGRRKFPDKINLMIPSMKKGYLRRKHEWDYIVVLMESFARSRYGREDVDNLVPEIWTGHHRGAILLALDRPIAKVLVAVDLQPNSCKSAGKIHGLCVKQ